MLVCTGYLGFYNRTCTTNVLPSKTAGPVLRRRGTIWEQWTLVDVVATSADSVRAKLLTYMSEDFDAR